MRTILAVLNNPHKLYTYLLAYWLISPLLYLIYVYIISQNAGTPFRELLNTPTVALAFLIACMTLVLAGMLKLAHDENENTVRVFSLYSAVQQLLVGNLIGVLLSVFLTRSLWWEQREQFGPRFKWVLVAGMVLIAFLTFLVLLAGMNFFHVV